MDSTTPGTARPCRLESVAAGSVVFLVQPREQRGAFGHPVALGDVELGVEANDTVEQRCRHGGCAIGEPAERGQSFGGEVRVAQHHAEHGGHHHGLGDLVRFDEVHGAAWVEQWHERAGTIPAMGMPMMPPMEAAWNMGVRWT